ncbi:MAG: DEAD/DEAH box helicase family protein [Armatimonadetes bacterium]|nr:DEAD/DEAH box helicase family protein [Armatimonadota bacterium]
MPRATPNRYGELLLPPVQTISMESQLEGQLTEKLRVLEYEVREDFQLTLHVQDEVRITHPTGNIFLTNIHRVFAGNEALPSLEDDNLMDYFLGSKPVGKTTDSKIDLGVIVRDIEELAVLNDEAHHIHDKKLAWFKCIQDIDNQLRQRDSRLAFQVDVTATPRHNNGAIFVQTVCDYPLVEAIQQNVVKHPVIPDEASLSKLHEQNSSKFTERYADYLNLGVVEWRQASELHAAQGKKAILFVMTDDTRNCDEVAEYLQDFPDLAGKVLTIHTKDNGEISEAASAKNKEELKRLRDAANDIDSGASEYRAIVSVLMLKEGWDVRNVTTIVGLRSYSAKSNILPEQTLGRGLRKMYLGLGREEVSVLGTPAFMDFVKSIQAEGVTLERRPMGGGTPRPDILVQVDTENPDKDLDALDIEVPILTPRFAREYKRISDLDPAKILQQPVMLQQYSDEDLRKIRFEYIVDGETSHETEFDETRVADGTRVVGFFARTVMKDLHLVSGYDLLYGKVKEMIQDHAFGELVDIQDRSVIKTLSEPAITKTIMESLKLAVNKLAIVDRGEARVDGYIKLREMRPFQAKNQAFQVPTKCVFDKVIGDRGFELRFSGWLDKRSDVVSWGKNFLGVGFKLDYVNSQGQLTNYIPDFFVKLTDGKRYIVETKGLEELDLPLKMQRLKQWCDDVNASQDSAIWDYVYVDQTSFETYEPTSFAALVRSFTRFRD